MTSGIAQFFPQLDQDLFRITSPPDPRYNCIAWALGNTDAWWWPGDPERTCWPEGVPRVATLEAFRLAFVQWGFEVCSDEKQEEGFDKIAMYADQQGIPKHAARQVNRARWSSKLGRQEDIEHGLRDLEGALYGSLAMVLKRPKMEQS